MKALIFFRGHAENIDDLMLYNNFIERKLLEMSANQLSDRILMTKS
jgi:hypothetical protein